MSVTTAAAEADRHGEQLAEHCDPSEHALPMATLTALMAEALTGAHLVGGHLVWLSSEVRDDGHLVVEATRVQFDEPTDAADRTVLYVGALEPVDLPAPPAADDLMPCGCHAGYCYCEAGYDPDPSSACSRCGQLACDCQAPEVSA